VNNARTLIRQLTGDSVVYGVALAINQLAPLLLWPLFTRRFSQLELGDLTLATSALSLVAVVATLGLDNSAHRWFWETTDEQDRSRTLSSWFWTQLASSLLFALLLMLVVFVLNRFGLFPSSSWGLYFFAALLVPLRAVMVVVNNWFRMRRQPLAVVQLNVLLVALIFGFTMWLVFGLRRGVSGVFEGQVYAHLVLLVLGVRFAPVWVRPEWFSSSRLREMLVFALPLIPAGLAGWSLSMSDRWLLNQFLSKDQVAVYQLSVFTAMLVGFPVTAFQQAWGPFALSIHQQENARKSYGLIAWIYVCLLVSLALLVALLAPEITVLVFSVKYQMAASSVPFLVFAQVLSGLYYIVGLGCNLAKQTKPVAAALFAGVAVQLFCNLLFLRWLGRDGAALSGLFAQLVMVWSLFVRAQRLYFIPFRVVPMVVVLLAGFVLAWLGSNGPLWGRVLLLAVWLVGLAGFVFWSRARGNV
jgi:O-antigen/teichoic acid export membrane protein